jgi:DNA replication and repair protein RecF
LELQKFSAQRFRNLSDLEMFPSSGMNVIYGENAQGKTSLLEAVFVLSTLRSFRTRYLPEVLQFGESGCLLNGMVRVGQGKHDLVVSLEQREKLALLDRKKADTIQYLGVFNVFLFSFPLLEVVRGGPEERRRFLDRSISVTRPGYLSALMHYHRAVKQKNALLLQMQRGEGNRKELIEEALSFNQQLLTHGIEIVKERMNYLSQLQELLESKKRLFFDSQMMLNVSLDSSFLAPESDVRKNLERILEREIQRGSCLLGVHRDEIRMTVNGKELRKYGSSGQHRAFLLLLLLGQLELYERWREDRPVLLLDDLDSELDQMKIQAFLEEIRNKYQTLISSSRRELFSGDGNVHLFEIASGKLLERN